MLGTRIALDVMGGDHAPDALLAGALEACSPLGTLHMKPERILLVGDEARIRAGLEEQGGNPGFAIQHASEVIGMEEKPGVALRAKRDASVSVAVGAVKTGQAGALVSMGNTGAAVGAATMGLGMLPGVRRPGIAVTMELTRHPVTMIDMGANVAPKAEHLLQYGVMGSVYMRDCLGSAEPRVGLLNIGQEPSKGTGLSREAFGLLNGAETLQFVGNLEAGDIFQDRVEVVVTDGFTGNVALKLMEGLSGFLLHLVEGQLNDHGVRWAPEVLAAVRHSVDYAEYGGALLLGVNGICVIGHGRSDAKAVANALSLAARALDADVNGDIVRGLEATAQGPLAAEGS
jgi:glycerol-3-phosphate acyltransferase PlsX